MNKKGLLAVLGSVCLLSVGLAAAVSSYTGRNQSLLQGNAIEPNPETCEFSVRNEGNAFNITTSEHREGGYFLDVQSGNFEQWKCGLVNFNYPGLTENQVYYCEFELTVNVDGAATAGGAQYCDIRVRANENKLGAGEGFKDDFRKNVKFVIGTNFTALASNNEICLQLGALRDSSGANKFTALIERFVIKKGSNVGEIVRRVDFESGEAFAGRWKAANTTNFFCTKGNVENYIYDYYSLYTAQRTIAGATKDVEGNRTIAKTIEYLVAYHNM